jgi:hypothetical protein
LHDQPAITVEHLVQLAEARDLSELRESVLLALRIRRIQVLSEADEAVAESLIQRVVERRAH